MKSDIAVIDFGTGKIVTLIAATQAYNTQGCDIKGVGRKTYQGFSNGEWNDPAEVPQAVYDSFKEAMKQSQSQKIEKVYVGVPGGFTHVNVFNVSVEIQGSDPHVAPEHIDQIIKKANKEYKDFRIKDENGIEHEIPGIVIHYNIAWFMVDGGKKVMEPVGMRGRELSAMISFVVVNQTFTNYISRMLESMNYPLGGFASGVLGEAKLFIPETERDKRAAMIDVGYLNTEFFIAEGDAVIFHDVYDIGGGHIAAAIAQQLDLHMGTAEILKKKFEFALTKNDQIYNLANEPNHEKDEYTQQQLEECVHPVIDEICSLVLESIKKSGTVFDKKNSIYLTGGGIAPNKGAREYMGQQMEWLIKEPRKATINMTEPYFASSMGLLDIVLEELDKAEEDENAVKGFFRSLFGL